jgi:hypoxanthine phosphoribosyltransferase
MEIWICPSCNRKWQRPNKKMLCICGTKYIPGMPPLPNRLLHFSYALYKHLLNGFPTCTEDQVQTRLDICKECNLYTGTHCSHASCGCNINGSVKFLNKLAWADQQCPESKWGFIRPQWVTTVQLARDIFILSQILEPNISAIVGVSRSGLLVGSQLASYLHLPLFSLDIFKKEMILCGSGYRLKDKKETDGFYLVVDDTVASGQTMMQAKKIMDVPFKTAAVYVVPNHQDKVDYYVRQLALPHFLEWNFFNSHYNVDVTYDMDGVICEDAVSFDDFKEKIKILKPLYLPRNKPIPIVTGRQEKYREITMDWLTYYGVEVESLIMTSTDEEFLFPADYKAKHIKTKIFVESSVSQAHRIKELRPELTIICPNDGVVL